MNNIHFNWLQSAKEEFKRIQENRKTFFVFLLQSAKEEFKPFLFLSSRFLF